MPGIVGWDIGGVNVKATWIEPGSGATANVTLPFEIWRARDLLPGVLLDALRQVAPSPPDALAITMTAELSDVFMTKREGVSFVLDSVQNAFPTCPALVLDVGGRFVPLPEARTRPLDFAAANWVATAKWLSQYYPDCILLDVGSTSTDIIPILHGAVAATGRNDLDRLLAGELVYTGALRTHLAAIVHEVPVAGRLCPVSAEYFAISGDVHLVLGYLAPDDYSCPTPDGRPASVENARARLARLVCADRDQLGDVAIDGIARYVYRAQLRQITRALHRVCSRLHQFSRLEQLNDTPANAACEPHPAPARGETLGVSASQDSRVPVVVMGQGAFLGRAAADMCRMENHDLAERWGEGASRVAPSWAAAHLLAAQLAHKQSR